MSAREIVKELTGPGLEAVRRAHADRARAAAMYQEVMLNLQIAEGHLRDVLVAASNDGGDGLRFDPDKGTIYREVSE